MSEKRHLWPNWQHHLFLKAKKFSFHLKSTNFLGYVFSPNSITMEEGKVEAITSWPVPTTVKELQRFLGFTNFYRRFISGYSSVVTPLMNLLKKGPRTPQWIPEAD